MHCTFLKEERKESRVGGKEGGREGGREEKNLFFV